MNFSLRNPWILVGLVLMVIPSIVMMSAYWSELSDVQACMALEQGFDYRTGECIQGNTIFVAFSERHPLMVNSGMILSMIGLLACMVGLYKK